MVQQIHRAEVLRGVPADASPETIDAASRDTALLWQATNLAISGAFENDCDFPVGAVVASGDVIVGRGTACDKLTGHGKKHGEYMALWNAEHRNPGKPADTLAVNLEPCRQCAYEIAEHPDITRVVFSIAREDVVRMGLVNPRSSIYEIGPLPYEVVHSPDMLLRGLNRALFANVRRDPRSQTVTINRRGINNTLSFLRFG